jgi:hypothetical protein
MRDDGRNDREESLDSSVWKVVDRLVETAPRLSDLRNHGIDLFAARLWRAQGRDVPAALVDEERRIAVLTLGAPTVLRRAREAYDGTILLLKGPEVARLYPDQALRRFRDLDLLVDDVEEAYHALIRAGFEPIGDPDIYVGIHHLRPLWVPGLPVPIELHSRPKWIDHVPAPPVRELFAAAVESSVGVDGVLTLPPAHHAVTLAAHSWAHEPLRRLRDVLDVAAMLAEGNRREADSIAGRWGIQRLWRTTVRAVDAVLHGGSVPWTLRVWARNLPRARERTVLESHLERWLSNFAVLPPRRALVELSLVVGDEIRPEAGETWAQKLARTRTAVRNAYVRRSEHDEELERGERL